MGRTACTEPQCLYKGALVSAIIVTLWQYGTALDGFGNDTNVCSCFLETHLLSVCVMY